MDSLSTTVTKAISELLERGESRYNQQATNQEAQSKLLNDVQSRLRNLEIKCQNLVSENNELKEGIGILKETLLENNKKFTQSQEALEMRCQKITDENRVLKEELNSTKGTSELHVEKVNLSIADIERKLISLSSENMELKKEIKLSESYSLELSLFRAKLDDIIKDTSHTKADLADLKNVSKKLEEWAGLTTVIASEVRSLMDFKRKMEEDMNGVHRNQSKIHNSLNFIDQHMTRLEQMVSRCIRPPVKSPSSSSLLNGMSHRPSSRSKSINQDYLDSNSYIEEDAAEELSAINQHATELRQQIEAMNQLQRSSFTSHDGSKNHSRRSYNSH